jgi:hypothetical protein
VITSLLVTMRAPTVISGDGVEGIVIDGVGVPIVKGGGAAGGIAVGGGVVDRER